MLNPFCTLRNAGIYFTKIIAVKASGVFGYQFYEKMLDFVLC